MTITRVKRRRSHSLNKGNVYALTQLASNLRAVDPDRLSGIIGPKIVSGDLVGRNQFVVPFLDNADIVPGLGKFE